MPNNYVDSLVKKGLGSKAELEKKWDKAKQLAKEADHEEDYDYVTGIFKKMVGINESPMTFREFLEESIPYSLSSANANAEYARGVGKSSYKGKIKVNVTELNNNKDYNSIKKYINDLGVQAEIGTSDSYKTVLLSSKTQTSAQMIKLLKLTGPDWE